MSALDLVKNPYFLTGLGATGVGGVGLIGWQALGGSGSEANEFVFLNVDDVKIDTNAQSPKFASYGCFQNFFPNTHIDNGKEDEESDIVTKNGSELKILPTSNPSTPNGDLVGCSLMKMSHHLEIPKWHLQAEITAKNDKVGWALWVSAFAKPYSDKDTWANKKITTFNQNLDYRLVLLEKESGSKWVVKAGYSWKDRSIEGKKFNIHIEVPNEENKAWIDQKHSGNEDEITQQITNSPETTYSYSGVWESKSTGKDIFEGIQIWGENKSKAEILGNSGVFKTRGDDRSKNLGYNFVDIGYKKRINKWANYMIADESDDNSKSSFALDISSVLTEWYKPFKGQKGEWTEISEYCKDNTKKLSYMCSK